MEFQKVVQEKVDTLVSSGAVDKIIETHLAKSIDSVIKDILCDYGDFGKQLKAAIGKKLELNLDNLNIESYTAMICRTIEDTLNSTVLQASVSKVQTHVKEVLAVIEKKQWKLSEIIMKYRGSLHVDRPFVDVEYKEETYGNYVSLGERQSGGSRFGSGKNLEFTLHLDKKENKIFAVSNRGGHINPLSDKPHRWEIFLMQLWVNECTVEIDFDQAEAVGNRDEDY